MSESKYPVDFDYLWLASDRVGHVATFTTGATGPIPATALVQSLGNEETIEECLGVVSERAGYKMHVEMPIPNDYSEFAQKGFFTYDWTDVNKVKIVKTGKYEIISTPVDLIIVDELPILLKEIVSRTRFADISFSECQEIDVRNTFNCIEE